MVFVKDTAHSTHRLLIMTEKLCQCLDMRRISGTLLTEFSKTFIACYMIFFAKLAAYNFDYDSLDFIQSYLLERQQRTKVNNAYSTYSDILNCVPKGYTMLTAFQYLY